MLKNIKRFSLVSILIIAVSLIFIAANKTRNNSNKNYYFHPQLGNDNNTGTDSNHPFRSLSKIKDLNLVGGDSILLAANQIFTEAILLNQKHGEEKKPIVISSYGANKKEIAKIKTVGDLYAIHLKNSSNIKIGHLEISALPDLYESITNRNQMRCGVFIETTLINEFKNITLHNLKIHDVFYEKENFSRPKNEVKSANGTQNYGWGIRVISRKKGSKISNLKIKNCSVTNVSHTGIKLTAQVSREAKDIDNFIISNTEVRNTGGPGIQMSGVSNGHVFNNIVNYSGSSNDSRKWGRGSGLWTWSSNDILIEKNKFLNANGPGDSAGAHIDFNCRNIVLQYNLSANNSGGFCEILGNNYNCAYRYNISYNDGYRIKDKNGAFQEGKILWLSGYVGNKKPRKGPFNSYIYNNTIFVNNDVQAKISIDKNASGILIANNIFHVKNQIVPVKGDQYNPEKEGLWQGKNILFTNNLFLENSTWPKSFVLQDNNPFYGDAKFNLSSNIDIKEFSPKNKKLIKDKGIRIQKIVNDDFGLLYGLNPKKDILGNPIINMPDLGAIELK